MDNQTVKNLALANGFKLKEQPNGELDLNPYVYEFANALEKICRTYEPVLDAPARVGSTKFQKGIRWSTLVECAQRYFNYIQSLEENQTNKPDISLIRKIVSGDYVLMPAEPTREIYQAFNNGFENKAARNTAEAFKFGYAEIVKFLEQK